MQTSSHDFKDLPIGDIIKILDHRRQYRTIEPADLHDAQALLERASDAESLDEQDVFTNAAALIALSGPGGANAAGAVVQ